MAAFIMFKTQKQRQTQKKTVKRKQSKEKNKPTFKRLRKKSKSYSFKLLDTFAQTGRTYLN